MEQHQTSGSLAASGDPLKVDEVKELLEEMQSRSLASDKVKVAAKKLSARTLTCHQAGALLREIKLGILQLSFASNVLRGRLLDSPENLVSWPWLASTSAAGAAESNSSSGACDATDLTSSPSTSFEVILKSAVEPSYSIGGKRSSDVRFRSGSVPNASRSQIRTTSVVGNTGLLARSGCIDRLRRHVARGIVPQEVTRDLAEAFEIMGLPSLVASAASAPSSLLLEERQREAPRQSHRQPPLLQPDLKNADTFLKGTGVQLGTLPPAPSASSVKDVESNVNPEAGIGANRLGTLPPVPLTKPTAPSFADPKEAAASVPTSAAPGSPARQGAKGSSKQRSCFETTSISTCGNKEIDSSALRASSKSPSPSPAPSPAIAPAGAIAVSRPSPSPTMTASAASTASASISASPVAPSASAKDRKADGAGAAGGAGAAASADGKRKPRGSTRVTKRDSSMRNKFLEALRSIASEDEGEGDQHAPPPVFPPRTSSPPMQPASTSASASASSASALPSSVAPRSEAPDSPKDAPRDRDRERERDRDRDRDKERRRKSKKSKSSSPPDLGNAAAGKSGPPAQVPLAAQPADGRTMRSSNLDRTSSGRWATGHRLSVK